VGWASIRPRIILPFTRTKSPCCTSI
jgi:hypothetical protein